METYDYPIGITSQFKFCGNPFRIDTYKGCTFGCKYCFANNLRGNINDKILPSNIEMITKMFSDAFNGTDKLNLTIEMLKAKIPLHLGGLADPFQPAEFENKITYKLLQLSNKYKYPIIISTKSGMLPSSYLEILDPTIHAFQISLISKNLEYIRKFEVNSPEPENRISLIKQLKTRGFWVGLRVQPFIDLDEHIKLIKYLEPYINYITIEHLKIGFDNPTTFKEISKFVNLNRYRAEGREYEQMTDLKEQNINEVKKITNLPIGCGDNDLHHLSTSRCCCGIDTINSNFDNWLKYNQTYFITGEHKLSQTNYPKCNVRSFLFPSRRKNGYTTIKQYTDYFMREEKYIEKDDKFIKAQESLF